MFRDLGLATLSSGEIFRSMFPRSDLIDGYLASMALSSRVHRVVSAWSLKSEVKQRVTKPVQVTDGCHRVSIGLLVV